MVLQSYMVPPAFPKVWQLTLQRVLHHLEPDAEDVQEKHIPENESLQEGEDPGIKEMISHILENIESLQVGGWVGGLGGRPGEENESLHVCVCGRGRPWD